MQIKIMGLFIGCGKRVKLCTKVKKLGLQVCIARDFKDPRIV